MEKGLFLLPLLLFTMILMAQPPQGPAKKGMTFGTSTTADGAIKADQLTTALGGKEKADVKVMGKVVEVCRAEGCWLKMQTAKGPMMIRMKDHSYFVPLALNGKTIVAEGTVTIKETSVAMLKHYAEDGGKTKTAIAAIKKPRKEMMFDAKGILVL